MIGLAIDFSKRSKLIDDEIDQISLSSEEDMKDNDEHKLDQEIYNKESIRINELYNNEENDESMNKYFGTKNELSEVKIIPNPFTIEDNYNFVCAGHVLNKSFERKFIISADSTIGTLDLDNIIFNENKIPIGYIDDVLGKIDSPLYIIKFFPDYNGNFDLAGQKLFFVKEKAKFVNKIELIKLKGSDASNAFDEEIDDDEKEFSDDDEERSKKEKSKKHHNGNNKKVNSYKPTNYIAQNPNSYFNHFQQLNNNKNCQEYKINNGYGFPNNNIFNNSYNNNFAQQQYFANMTMFNPTSMFGPYSNNPMNSQIPNQNSNQTNPSFFQHINPFIHNNFNN
jgi:H/ACA ribonucleoprotein complex non-core subunit NAF1